MGATAAGQQLTQIGSGGLWTVIGGHYETLIAGSGADTGRYILTRHDQTKLVFDGTAPGRLVRIENRVGKALSFSWGSSSATATDASGRATTLAIDAANNRITSATDSAGRAWSFAYTGTDLTSVTDPAGKVSTFAYDASHRLGRPLASA